LINLIDIVNRQSLDRVYKPLSLKIWPNFRPFFKKLTCPRLPKPIELMSNGSKKYTISMPLQDWVLGEMVNLQKVTLPKFNMPRSQLRQNYFLVDAFGKCLNFDHFSWYQRLPYKK
jgi:hypothetical protein